MVDFPFHKIIHFVSLQFTLSLVRLHSNTSLHFDVDFESFFGVNSCMFLDTQDGNTAFAETMREVRRGGKRAEIDFALRVLKSMTRYTAGTIDSCACAHTDTG